MSGSLGYIRLPRIGKIALQINVAVVIIALIIIGDCLSGLLFNLGFSFHRVGLIIKSIVTVFALVHYSPMIRKRTYRSIYITMAVLLLVWLVAAAISFMNNPLFSFSYSVVVLNRYFFFLILAIMFVFSAETPGFDQSCRTILDTFFIINNTLILLGFAFGIYWLSSFDPTNSYGGEGRFGYKGLIFGNNEIAGVYAIGMAYYFRESFKYRRKRILLLLFTCVAAILTGAKAALLGLVLIGGYYFIRYQMKYLLLLVLPGLIGLGAAIVHYWDLIAEKYLKASVDLFNSVDFIFFVTSGRDGYLRAKLRFIREFWSPLQYLIGDAFLYIEMDFFDIYFFFGIASILYLYVYARIFFLRDKSLDNLYFFVVFMALAFVAGHVFQSAIVPLFVLLYIFSTRTRVHGNATES